MKFHRQPLLVMGGIGTAPGTPGMDQIWIYLDEDLRGPDLAETIWHETVHLLMMAAGIPAKEHDEDRIDELGARLAKCCPEIASLLGLDPPNAPLRGASHD